MQYRPLGRSSLTVSSIALGSWLTYAGGIEQSQGIACIHAALDLGINFFDTANIYGRGAAESLLGDALQGIPRDRYVLATKLFYPMTEQDRGLSRAQVFKQLDASLTRLRTDHVDLYQCHEYDDEVPLEETLDALSQAVSQGKVRYIGFSNWTAEQVERAAQVTGVERFVSSQPQYSMLWRQPEADLFPTCKKHGISSIVWSPLAQGVLTGKYLPGMAPPADSRAASDSMAKSLRARFFNDTTLEAVQALRPIASAAGLTLPQLALAWVLRDEGVAAAIVGASRPEQLAQSASASGIRLGASTLQAIEAVLRSPQR